MEKWIGNRPTMGQKALGSKYERLLVQAQNTILSPSEKVLKVIEAECDKKSGRELDGVLILTTEAVVFIAKREHMVYTYSQISDIDVRTDGKDKQEWQITLIIGRSKRTFDDIKKNDDSQEFIEILEHKIVQPFQEILTTVTHDFDFFLHSDRLADLRTQGVKITAFLMKRDNQGHSKNGERLLREKHKHAELIVEGFYQEKQKTGNFIVVDNGVLLYEYNDKERTARQITYWPLSFFTNAVIDHFAIKTVVIIKNGKLVLNNAGKKFTGLLTAVQVPFKIKTRKWHQKIVGFRSGKWWKKTIASVVYLFSLIMIVAVAFGEDTQEADNVVEQTTEVSDTNTEKSNEAAQLEEEKRKQEEADRLAEEQRRQEEAARLAEEQRKKEEAARLAEEQRKQEEAARLAEEQRKQEEAESLAQKQQATQVYYKNCKEARSAGAAPIHRGEPGYAKHLDRDGDGVGCDR